jgi:hypothetical protein
MEIKPAKPSLDNGSPPQSSWIILSVEKSREAPLLK